MQHYSSTKSGLERRTWSSRGGRSAAEPKSRGGMTQQCSMPEKKRKKKKSHRTIALNPYKKSKKKKKNLDRRGSNHGPRRTEETHLLEKRMCFIYSSVQTPRVGFSMTVPKGHTLVQIQRKKSHTKTHTIKKAKRSSKRGARTREIVGVHCRALYC